jgi:acetoin utilization protein AcuB
MSITVRTWMTSPVHGIKLRDTVAHARELLETHRVNQLVVLRDGRLMGIVTDRDVRDASPSVAQELGGDRRFPRIPPDADPARIPVEDIMTADVETVGPDTPITEAAALMRRRRIGSVPVVDHGKVVGLLTRSDLLDALIEIAGRA